MGVGINQAGQAGAVGEINDLDSRGSVAVLLHLAHALTLHGDHDVVLHLSVAGMNQRPTTHYANHGLGRLGVLGDGRERWQQQRGKDEMTFHFLYSTIKLVIVTEWSLEAEAVLNVLG